MILISTTRFLPSQDIVRSQFNTPLLFSENPDQVEPDLAVTEEADKAEIAGFSEASTIKHLKHLRGVTEKHFGQENILTETQAQQVMIGVTISLPSGC